MRHKQLVFAREYRGFTQSELAKSIDGLSQSNLSKFEKGFDILSNEIQDKVIKFLDFPKDFFSKDIDIRIDNANYRKKSSTRKKDIIRFENKCKIIGYAIDEMADTIEWVNYTLKSINIDEGFDINYIARYARRMLKITEDEPIRDIITIFENAGIIIYEIDALEGFDGISFFTKKGYPIIIINKYNSNDRKRFTLAHELGHLIMHNENDFPISEFRDKEIEANAFASEFLMPQKYIQNSLRNIKISDLTPLKKYWLTSKSSIIRRAKDLNCIDSNKATYFNIELSRNGERKREKELVYIDFPSHIKNSYNLLKNNLGYNDKDFMNYFSLPKDVINEIFNIEKRPTLRVL